MSRHVGLLAPALLMMILTSCGRQAESVSTASPATETVARPTVSTEAPTSTLMPISTATSVPTATAIPIFQPMPGTLWQWELDTPVDTSVNAQVFDIDLFDNDASVVAALHAKGAKVICYISAGTREDWRPDANQFPKDVIGKADPGWQGENWIDIRQIDKLAPIMTTRMDLCKLKGFDGLEPDNIDAYTNETGFSLTGEDQLKYNEWLSQQAHTRGLSIGLKNDGDQASALVNDFDWALSEECFAYDECDLMLPFIKAGKQVVDVEYSDGGLSLNAICPQAKALGMDLIYKDRDLTTFRKLCP